MKELTYTLVSLAIIVFLGMPLYYMFDMKYGKYRIEAGGSVLDIPLSTDSITEDTIQHKITFTDLYFHKKFTIVGSYIITTNK